MNTIKVYILIFIITMAYWNAKAQVRYLDNGQIENTEILIEKNKKVTFPEINRTFEKINIPKKSGQPEPQKYDNVEIHTKVPELDPKIKILSIKDEAANTTYPNFVKAGIGNYLTTYAEGAVFSKTNNSYTLGLRARHFASALGPVSNSGTSHNYVEALGKYYYKKLIVSGALGYKYQNLHFYGYDHNLNRESSDVRQSFNTFYAKSQIENIDTLTKIDYQVRAEFYTLGDRYNARENEFLIDGGGKYELNDFSTILVNSSLSLTSRTDTSQQIRNLFQIKPQYEYLLNDKIKVRGGFNLAIENDTISNSSPIHFHPVMSGEYLLTEKLIVFGGLDGGMEKNVLRNQLEINPFLGPNIPLVHTNRLYELFAGLKGNATNNIYFSLSPSFVGYKNLSVFTPSLSDSSKYTITYDKSTSTLFRINASVSYDPSQQFKLGLKADYYGYQMGSLEKPWHRPNAEITAFGQYNLYNKIVFKLDISYISGIKAKNFKSGRTYELPDIVDISFKVDYNYNKRLSLFLYFYNILAQEYSRFQYYPNKGINIVGGVAFSF